MTNPNWQSYSSPIVAYPARLRPWILHSGSFMERLRDHGIQDPQVQVVQQSWQLPLPCEQEKLALTEEALIREVLITSHNQMWMFARTVFPRAVLTGDYEQLAHLENRSLGSVLFKDPAMRRSAFELATIQPDMVWFDKVQAQLQLNCDALWARRSVFDLTGKQILLTEIFLPGIENI